MAEQAELSRPATRGSVRTINPATGEPGRSYPSNSIDDARAAAKAARAAFERWRRTSFADRGDVIQ